MRLGNILPSFRTAAPICLPCRPGCRPPLRSPILKTAGQPCTGRQSRCRNAPRPHRRQLAGIDPTTPDASDGRRTEHRLPANWAGIREPKPRPRRLAPIAKHSGMEIAAERRTPASTASPYAAHNPPEAPAEPQVAFPLPADRRWRHRPFPTAGRTERRRIAPTCGWPSFGRNPTSTPPHPTPSPVQDRRLFVSQAGTRRLATPERPKPPPTTAYSNKSEPLWPGPNRRQYEAPTSGTITAGHLCRTPPTPCPIRLITATRIG